VNYCTTALLLVQVLPVDLYDAMSKYSGNTAFKNLTGREKELIAFLDVVLPIKEGDAESTVDVPHGSKLRLHMASFRRLETRSCDVMIIKVHFISMIFQCQYLIGIASHIAVFGHSLVKRPS